MVDRSTSTSVNSSDVSGSSIVTTRRIDHVAIAVRDADSTARRFVAEFGFTIGGDVESADGLVRLVYLDAGDTTLQVVQPLQAGSVSEWMAEQGEGLHHVCFEVADVRAALETLPGESRPTISTGGRGCPVAFLGDRRSGLLIELTQPSPVVAEP
jgi:methylmalonyl-CoA epimerase